jgi:tRNA pseudouridine38-40 synthase
MPRYAFVLQYNGSNYAGWQKQHQQATVQGEIERAFEILFNLHIPIVAAGRTDAGVHARQMVFHAEIDQVISDAKKVLKSLRGLTPKDILVQQIYLVKDDFHARFDALSRQYSYTFTDRLDLFKNQFEWVIRSGLPHRQAMLESPVLFEGIHDFASFSKQNPDLLNSNCEVFRCVIYEYSPAVYTLEIEANRFLHSMVRCITGVLVQIGQGKCTAEMIRERLSVPDFKSPRFLAPPHALFLDKVNYDTSTWTEIS